MKKTTRQNLIKNLIKEQVISTQDELVNALKNAGVEATQSTVSRDIREMELTKTMIDGKLRYKVPVSFSQSNGSNVRYGDVLGAGLDSVVVASQLLVIKTVSGMAMAVAAAIDAMNLGEIAGTIAGDDTIMVALKDSEDAQFVLSKIEELKK